MKRIIALLTAAVFILVLAGCSASNTGNQAKDETKAAETTKAADPTNAPEVSKATDETATENNDADNGGKALVVYFSATGTTKGVAEQIASAAGADIYEITAVEPYTSDDLDYNDSDSRTTAEQNDKTVRPGIAGETIDLSDYDTIYIGFPIWWGEEPRIMDTFVESYDFTGKTVIPFCTSGSSPIDNAAESLEANAGGGDWKDGRRFDADTSLDDIEEWLNTL